MRKFILLFLIFAFPFVSSAEDYIEIGDSAHKFFPVNDDRYLKLDCSNDPLQPSSDSITALQVLDADGGIPILNIDSTNERVGIGTAAPGYELDVVGNIVSQGGTFAAFGTGAHVGDYAYLQYDDVSGDGYCYVSGGNLVLGGSSGNVILYDTMNFVPYSTATASLGSVSLGFDGLYLAGDFNVVTPAIFVDDTGTAYSSRVTFTQPTATRTITVPDLTGTVYLTGTSQDLVTTGNITIDSDTGGLILGDAQDATLKWDDSEQDVDLNNDLNISDATPHIKLIDTDANQDDYEIYADDNQCYWTNVTDEIILLKADETDNLWTSRNFTTTGTGDFASINITDEATGYQVDGADFIRMEGSYNLFIGTDVAPNYQGTYNIMIGYQAGQNNAWTAGETGRHNVYIGAFAGQGATTDVDNTGMYNVAIGRTAMQYNTTGQQNFALGMLAMNQNTSGNQNVGIGYSALEYNTTGVSSMAIGRSALRFAVSTTGRNVAIGTEAGMGNSDVVSTTGYDNVFIGTNAGRVFTSGYKNSGIGAYALRDLTTGNENTAIGYYPMYQVTEGIGNTGMGYAVGGKLTTGDYNIFIGWRAGGEQTTADNLLIIDNQDRTTAANEAIQAIIYGVMAAAPTSQTLKFNAMTSTTNQASTLGVGATTFAATSNVMTITGDGGGNTIATITGANSGTLLTLMFVDALVTITDDDAHGANSVDLSAAFTSADDTVLQLVYNGTSWYEVSRSVN